MLFINNEAYRKSIGDFKSRLNKTRWNRHRQNIGKLAKQECSVSLDLNLLDEFRTLRKVDCASVTMTKGRRDSVSLGLNAIETMKIQISEGSVFMFRSNAILVFFLVAASLPVLSNRVVAQSTGDCIALSFSSEGCEQCSNMHKTTDKAIQEGWVVRRFDTKKDPHIAIRWQIQSVPTTVLVRNGREVDRIMGPIDYRELSRRMESASSVDSMRTLSEKVQSRSETVAPIVRGQSPLAMIPVASSVVSTMTVPNRVVSSPTLDLMSSSKSTSVNEITSSPAQNRESTVRIRIVEPNQDSVGTGTVIDMVNGEALVLTCGHLFRDIQGQASIIIDTFVGGQTQSFPGTLVDFEAKEMDIGLVAFRPSVAVSVARLIPRNRKLSEGQKVSSWGCNRGADPSPMVSQISKLNRYLGAPNVEVDGQPVEGRSGGGLFDERGELIGVCYAADPTLKEGLYSAADVVYHELSKLGLQRLFNERNDAVSPTERRGNVSDFVSAAPSSGRQETVEMTVIIKDRSGNQERLDIPQPSAQLLQAMRASVQR